jgi:hypothetical protein
VRWLVAIALLTAGAAGCVHVQPWERGVQADRRMRWAPCAQRAAAREHVYAVREGAQGGHGNDGGGCGCD